eukprot:11571067-Karenia_brevis.AAC.1
MDLIRPVVFWTIRTVRKTTRQIGLIRPCQQAMPEGLNVSAGLPDSPDGSDPSEVFWTIQSVCRFSSMDPMRRGFRII